MKENRNRWAPLLTCGLLCALLLSGCSGMMQSLADGTDAVLNGLAEGTDRVPVPWQISRTMRWSPPLA